jgi:hypothetical protein
MGLDNPNAPVQTTCDEPGCNRRHTNPPGQSRRTVEQLLTAAEWTWEAEYDQVHAYCPDHSTEPVRKARGSKR